MWDAEYPQVWFTYGKNTDDDEILRQIFGVGATGVRLTFSFGDAELQHQRARRVRAAAKAAGKSCIVVADLEGEKPRLEKDTERDEIALTRGDVLRLSKKRVPSRKEPELTLRNPDHIDWFLPGDIVIEGDGGMTLRVLELMDGSVICSAQNSGSVRTGRGLSIQSERYKPIALTEKDLADLDSIVKNSALYDGVAVSFVSTKEDITPVQKKCKKAGTPLFVMAKVETALGVKNISHIADESDAVMVARGDLALATPWVDLYANTRAIVAECKKSETPWIMATQVVEGVGRFAFPTRAEICDLAQWMTDGASGTMLSFETAWGERPIDAVACAARIVSRYAAAR